LDKVKEGKAVLTGKDLREIPMVGEVWCGMDDEVDIFDGYDVGMQSMRIYRC
jgi:hypothetical protein